jgi:hypothetical protein
MAINQTEHDLLGSLYTSTDLWDTLEYLCDGCGSRFAGTKDERKAGDYVMERFRAFGLRNVHAEPFEMRGWERGPARLTVQQAGNLIELPACLALPGTFGCDLEREIIDLGMGTLADFAKAGDAVKGKIVLTSSDGPGRGEKYQAAAAAGAAAFIFANATPGFLAPTGSIAGDLPGMGLAYEHAERIRRLLKKGPLMAHLAVEAEVKTVTARNIVGELPGADPSQGWILAGGHYDGHDICQGAQDNAAASAVLVESARLLAALRDPLQMGIRFVLFSGEELGLYGSHAYARAHAAALDEIRLVFNADVVALAMPLVLRTQASPELAAYFRTLPLAELDCAVNDGPDSFIQNSDHFPFSLAGVQAVWALTSHSASVVGWAHTAADTLDKVEPRLLRQTAASITRLLWRMASAPGEVPQVRKSAETVRASLVAAGFEKSLRASRHWPFD